MRFASVPPLDVSWLIRAYVLASVGSTAVGNARTPAGSDGLAAFARSKRFTVRTVPPALYVKSPEAAAGVSHVPVSLNDCGRKKNSNEWKKNSLFFFTG